ncbi:MAG: hypothetical protein ACR2RV_25300, partial [Verrucomicrobiales bacterium]
MNSSTLKLSLLACAGLILVSCKKADVEKEVIRPVKAMKVGDPSTMDKAVLTGKARATREVNIGFE